MSAPALQAQAGKPAAQCAVEPTYDNAICQGLVAQKQNDFAASAQAFEKAAQLAPAGDVRGARALAAAGNMWVAAQEPGKAAVALDRALAGTSLQAEQRGEALLDRARAAEAQNDLRTARARVTEAATTISEDPFLWYFSAALAIREGDKAVAQSAINKAMSLAPGDPTVLFEAGHVAHFVGDEVLARAHWSQAERADPNGPIGKAARAALGLLPRPADSTVKAEPAAPR